MVDIPIQDYGQVLIIAHGFPPVGGVGVQRPYKFTQYLPEFGWQPLVLTHKAKYSATWDPSLLDAVAHTPIHRAKDPMIELYARAFRNHKPNQQPVTDSTNIIPPSESKPPRMSRLRQHLKYWFKRIRDAVLIPDESVLWVPHAVRLGLSIVRTQSVRAIYSTSPPESSQLVAAIISEVTGIPLIVDFRDPWIGNLHRKSKGVRYQIEQLQETFVFTRATRIITVTESFRKSFIARYPQYRDKIFVVPNGYDAADLAAISPIEHPNRQTMVIYYGGILYEKRSPHIFLQGLARALDQARIPREAIRVEFAGVFDYPGKTANQDEVTRLKLTDVVEVVGYVSHQQHVQKMATAAMLLLIGDQTPGSESYIPAKLYEYLGSGKPILALASVGEATTLMQTCEAGWMADPSSPEDVANVLEQIYTTWCVDGFANFKHSPLATRYERREQTQMLAKHLQEIAH